MKKEDFLQMVDEMSKVAQAKKFIKDHELEEDVDLDGLNLADAKAAITEFIESLEDDDELFDESETGVEDSTEENDDENEGSNKRNANKKVKTTLDIAKELMKDKNRDIDNITRTVKYVNSLRDVEGEYGDYEMGTLTIDSPIEGYVAETDEDTGETTYTLGDQTLINFMVPTMIATLRENKQLAGIYNKVKADTSLLYQVLAGTEVRMLVEYVPKNTDWVNPFSHRKNPTVRNYDHDVVIAMIYDIKNLGPTAELWADMELLGGAAMNPAVAMALLERAKKTMKSKKK